MINVNRVGESITGSYPVVKDGKPSSTHFGVKFSQEKYDAMKEIALASESVETAEALNALVEQLIPLTVQSYIEQHPVAGTEFIYFNPEKQEYYLKAGDKVSKEPMPQNFVNRLLTSIEKGIDILPLVKFYTRLLRNPNYTRAKAQKLCKYIAKTYLDRELAEKLVREEGVSDVVAIERATGLQTPITQEGLLVTYKVSSEIKHKYELDEKGNRVRKDRYTPTKTINDITGEISVTENLPEFVEDRIFEPAVMGRQGDEFYCGDTLDHVIRVGQVHKLDKWSQVDCNDNHSCVPGLHVGNLDYIRGYQGSGTETHNTFVDPMHVGAVTDDGSGALRVKQYFTHSSFAGVNRSIYHSSKYAAMTDAEWAEMRAAAVANAMEVSKKFVAAAAEIAEQD